MFKFKARPKILEIKGVKIGGFPFNPPVMIGTIFYHKHKIVSEPRKGEFNKEVAQTLIKSQEELSDVTKIPALVDVAAETSEAMIKYIDFVAEHTDKPFLVDVPSKEIMEAAIKHANEVGIVDRVIVNSLTPKAKDEELKLLQEYKVKNIILLLYTIKIMDVNARIDLLNRILQRIKAIGIATPLIDTFVIDIPSLAASMRTIIYIKTNLGLPTGCGAHNAVSSMRKQLRRRYGREGLEAIELISNIAPITLGADFVLYGPIEIHKHILPAAYAIYTSYRYLSRKPENLLEL